MADDTEELLREARAQGWRVERTKRGHWQCYAPDGETIVVISGTTGDRRSLKQAIAEMRRAGFIWKGH